MPVELEAIVMEALALKREERYESCNAFGDALAGFLAATAPRFSALSLSHFVQDLFREDIASTGRQVQVPGSFQEQLAQWRGQSPTAVMASGRPRSQAETHPEPTTDKAAAAGQNVETRIVSPRKGMSAGAIVGLVGLVAAVLGGGLFAMKGLKPKVAADPSNPQPLHLTEAPLAPPPEPALPPPAPTDTAPEPTVAAPQEPPRAEEAPPSGATEVDVAPAPEAEPAPELSPEEQEAKAAYDSATQLLEKKRFAHAEQQALRCIKLTPKNAECYLVAAEAASGQGQFDKTVGYYRKFLGVAPDHEQAPQIRKRVTNYERAQSQRPPSQ